MVLFAHVFYILFYLQNWLVIGFPIIVCCFIYMYIQLSDGFGQPKCVCRQVKFPKYVSLVTLKFPKYLCSEQFFLIDRVHKGLKNTIDLLLFYGEHFYGFSESDLRKRRKNNIHFTTNISIYIRVTDILKFYEVLFCTYFKGLFCP